MADPISMIAIGSTIAGTITSATAANYSGQASANMYNYQAGIAQANKVLAQQDANYAISSGEVAAQQSGMKTRAQVGATRAGFGASNVAGGSQDAVLKSETDIGQEDQALIRSNAAKRAFGFNVEAAKDTAQGQVYKTAAETSQETGRLGVLSSIIGGASNVAGKWLQYKQYFGSGDSGAFGDSPALA